MDRSSRARDKSDILDDINKTIDLLYITQCRETKNTLLNRLRQQIGKLSLYERQVKYMGDVVPANPQSRTQNRMASPTLSRAVVTGPPQGPTGQRPPMAGQTGQNRPAAPTAPAANPPAQPKSEGIPARVFTVEELSQFDGLNGKPAYVAVNGIVYDVTDDPGWAAGAHFGLKAGLDQTSAYISCHTGQPLINMLNKVGRLKE